MGEDIAADLGDPDAAGRALDEADAQIPLDPPKEMLDRRPDLMKSMVGLQSGIGMHGGPANPLGARAMYLWQGNKDTYFRIHGTNEPWTIGSSQSSGCNRMINQDAMDLYQKTPIGTRVVVLGFPGAVAANASHV